MARLIKESFFLTATTVDILAAPSRLAAIPANGTITIEATTSDCDGTNFGTLTVQQPSGDIPLQDVIVPVWAAVPGTDAVMDTDTEFIVQLSIQQGGHLGLDYTMNGTVVLCLVTVTLIF